MSESAMPSEQPVPDLRLPLEILAEEFGAVAGQIEREAGLRIAAAISDMRAAEAERELRFAKMERMIEERLAALKDGVDGKDGRDGIDGRDGTNGSDADPVAIETAVAKAIAAMPAPKDGSDGKDGRDGADGKDGRDGKDVDPAQLAALVSEAIAALPPPKDGRDGADGKDGIDGRDGATGKLPAARAWTDEVHYAGDVVTHGGSMFQASRDTAKEPPHADWICLAAAGRDGADGRSFTIRGTFASSCEYRELDVVCLNGASFAAKRDNPGACPGDGWQLIAMQGGRGKPGERGLQGPAPAPIGTKVEALSVDKEGLLTLKNDDGSTVTCDLYPLLAKIA